MVPQCNDGDTKLTDDGCNTCVCVEEQWACTEMVCVQDDTDFTDPESSLFEALLDPNSPLYWLMMFVALSVILGSVASLLSFTRGYKITGDLFSQEEE